jgi:putative addiction module component (TIGR02574 family)
LAYDLLDSVAQGEAAGSITEAQRAELRRRLAEYRANPNEPVVTLAEMRARLITRERYRGRPSATEAL